MLTLLIIYKFYILHAEMINKTAIILFNNLGLGIDSTRIFLVEVWAKLDQEHKVRFDISKSISRVINKPLFCFFSWWLGL